MVKGSLWAIILGRFRRKDVPGVPDMAKEVQKMMEEEVLPFARYIEGIGRKGAHNMTFTELLAYERKLTAFYLRFCVRK